MKRFIYHFRYSAVFTSLLFIFGCSGGNSADKGNKAIPIRVMAVAMDNDASCLNYIGVIEEESAASLSFQVMGNIEEVYVVEGQRVKKGQLLAALNTANLQSTYDAALATLRQAEDASSRLTQLHENGSLPEVKYVEVQTNLSQAKSMAEIAKKNLDDSRLIAPFDGVIGIQRAELGENTMPGTTVFTLLKIKTVKVKVAIPENEISLISNSDKATVSITALRGSIFEGVVSEKGIVSNPVAHTYDVKIKLNNSNEVLLPGMICNVRVMDNKAVGGIIIPNNAVMISHTGQKMVWIVSDSNEAIAKEVVTGALTSKGVIIESGLSQGDTIIIEGYHKVSNGSKVEVL